MAADLLNAIHVRNARPGYDPTEKDPAKQPRPDQTFKMRDGKGLFLEVRPSGKKVWRYRYRLAGVEQTYTIGEAGEGADQISLTAAREARSEARKLVKMGKHPKAERDEAKALTIRHGMNLFGAIAEEWYQENKPHWSEKYAAQVRAGLDNDILPGPKGLRDKPIRSVTSSDALAIVKGRKDAPAWAQLMHLWVGSIFRYAIAHQLADTDPTYAIRGAIRRPAVKHHKPLPLKEIPAFLAKLDDYGGNRQTVLFMRLLLLTFVRPGELRAAEWSEIDATDNLLRIPANRMKMRRPHLVPLSTQALAVLAELRTITGGQKYLFPNFRKGGTFMDQATPTRVLKSIGYQGTLTAHGFRATASTALNERGEDAELVELQLAHAPADKIRAVYNHAKRLPERAGLMQRWADMIDAAGAPNVVPIKTAAA